MLSRDVLQQAYRGSVALNNNGVCLMVRQAYLPALLTLQDSLKTMRILFEAVLVQTNDSTRSVTSKDVLEGINSSIRKATLRMAQTTTLLATHPGHGKDSVTLYGATSVRGVKVLVFCTGDFDTRSAAGTQNQDPDPSTLYAIRFDDVDSCSDGTFDSVSDNDSLGELLQMHIAIILFNMALVRFCMSLTTTPPLVIDPANNQIRAAKKKLRMDRANTNSFPSISILWGIFEE